MSEDLNCAWTHLSNYYGLSCLSSPTAKLLLNFQQPRKLSHSPQSFPGSKRMFTVFPPSVGPWYFKDTCPFFFILSLSPNSLWSTWRKGKVFIYMSFHVLCSVTRKVCASRATRRWIGASVLALNDAPVFSLGCSFVPLSSNLYFFLPTFPVSFPTERDAV